MMVFPAKETGAEVGVNVGFDVGLGVGVGLDVGLVVGVGVVPGVQASRSTKTRQSKLDITHRSPFCRVDILTSFSI